ncbi:MAG: hypothetical protein ACP5SF_04400 [Thermoplasmata archaeon]
MNKIYKEKGVSSVIGTLFALLLAVTLLSAFMTQYVPVYMKTNEAQHDLEVLSDFSQIKTFTDLLVATGEENYSFTVPITMGANGIPIFAPSTPSMLKIVSSTNPIFILNMSSLNGKNIYQNSSGYFSITIYNSYYPEENIIFVNGAVVRENINENASTVYVGPGFSIQHSTKGYVLNFIIYDVLGAGNSYSGTDTLNIQIALLGIQKITYTGIGYANISINPTYSFANSLTGWYLNQSTIFGFPQSQLSLKNNNILSFDGISQVNVEIAYMNVQFSSY